MEKKLIVLTVGHSISQQGKVVLSTWSRECANNLLCQADRSCYKTRSWLQLGDDLEYSVVQQFVSIKNGYYTVTGTNWNPSASACLCNR